MSLQANVNRNVAKGIEGDRATQNPIVTVVRLAGAPVRVGYAVWEDSKGNFVNVGSGAPVGLAMSTKTATYTTFTDDSGMYIPTGQAVTAAVKGDVYVKSSSIATNAQKIFADNTTGKLSAADAGTTVPGTTETDFYICDAGGAIGTLLTASTWRAK